MPETVRKNNYAIRSERANNAASDLTSAEQSAATEIIQPEDSLNGTREHEEQGFYRGFNGERSQSKNSGKKGGFLKRKGPMGLIISLIFGVGGIMGVSQLSQPFSLIENLRETFNSMQTSVDTRSSRFLKMQMDSGRVKNPLKAKLFGGSKFKITGRQANKLAKQGIYIDDDFKVEIEGKTQTFRVLKFDDGTGNLRIVAADSATTAKLNKVDLSTLDADGTLGMKFSTEAISFADIYASNSDFYYGYNKGSKTWRGAVSGWFDSVTAKFLASNKLTRNLFKNWQEEVAKAGEGNTKKVASDLMAKRGDSIDADGEMERTDRQTTTEEVDNGDGTTTSKTTVEVADTKTSTGVSSGKMSAAEVQTKLKGISDKFGGGDVANKVVNTVCLVSDVVGAISLMVSASEALQIISLVTGYFEAIDKAKAGDGDASPIHDFASSLNETKEIEYTELTVDEKDRLSTGDWSGESVSIGSGEVADAFGYANDNKKGSAMTSSGIASVYGGGRVDPNDASVKSLNFSSSINTIMAGIGTSMVAFETCALSKMTVATAGLIKDAVEVGACVIGVIGAIFSFGTSTAACGPLIKSAVIGIAASVGLGILISGIISAITPVVTQALTRDLITDIAGEDLGNALASGANMYMGGAHRSNGGSLATRDEYIAFAAEQQRVIANNAKYERMDRSPFDVTSQYTFLGTLMNSLLAFSTSNSLMSTLSSGITVVSSAVTSLMPTSSAMEISDHLYTPEEYEVMCPYLASIGATGDAYCNPYIITDVSTMDIDPADVIEEIDKMGDNFVDEEGDNVKIAKNSDLAKYILYCNNRNSQFGVADQNIVSSIANAGTVNTGTGFDNVANSVIGAVPILGDGFDIYNNKKSLQNAGYISGETCVAGNNMEDGESYAEDVFSATPSWNKAKYYQRFIEDQSLAESMGLIEESAVTAYLDEYYEENPLDQSYEGILARYSGLEKEDVVALLDVIEWGNYIANYDPSERYAFAQEFEIPDGKILFEESNFEQVVGAPVYAIVYTDLRNRNFAA